MVSTITQVIKSVVYGETSSHDTETATKSSCPLNVTSTSNTFGLYGKYLDSLIANSYSSYIHLRELEQIWGMWNTNEDDLKQLKIDPTNLHSAPGPLFRLVPALTSMEITARLILEVLDDPRSYVDHTSKLNGLFNNFSIQCTLLRELIDLDLQLLPLDQIFKMYQLKKATTSAQSLLSISQKSRWNRTKDSSHIFERLHGVVNGNLSDLPFGFGFECYERKKWTIPYDQLVFPNFIHTMCRQGDKEYVEDHFFASTHQITEAWLCTMERQMDIAQESLRTRKDSNFQRGARRLRYCGRIWEYLCNNIWMLSYMDAKDYLSLKLLLHGASGGQSVRLRRMALRIPTLLTLDDVQEKTPLQHIISCMKAEEVTETPTSECAMSAQVSELLKCQQTPECYLVDLLNAIQMLESCCRRFFYGHQQLAEMVLGAAAIGTQKTSVKRLERGWKGGHRYLIAQRAKEALSRELDAVQLENDSSRKGRIITQKFQAAQAHLQKLNLEDNEKTSMDMFDHHDRIANDMNEKETQLFQSLFQQALVGIQDLHLTSHGMGFPPDVALQSITNTFFFISNDQNESWETIFTHDIPKAQSFILKSLGLTIDTYHVNFGSNTHEFVTRLFSTFEEKKNTVRILTSCDEFLSFTRQVKRWEQVGKCIVDRVSLLPFETFTPRLLQQSSTHQYDMIYISAIYSNTQLRLSDESIAAISQANPSTVILVDVAQALENVPLNFSSASVCNNLFIVGSGIKHACAGPGLGFLAYPIRKIGGSPVSTGWIADVSVLSTGKIEEVVFPQETTFYGSTPGFHYALRQYIDVQEEFERHGLSIQRRHMFVLSLCEHFIQKMICYGMLRKPDEKNEKKENLSNAIVFHHSQADWIVNQLKQPDTNQMKVYADAREGKYIRLGFGIHHTKRDIIRLGERFFSIWQMHQMKEPLTLVQG